MIFRCGPHLHWAPHIEDKRHPRKVTEWPRREVEQHPLAHGAHDTQKEYHMWVNGAFTRIRTQSNGRRAWREFCFHDRSFVWWLSLSWPSTHPGEMGQVILYTQISTLSAESVKFVISEHERVCTQVAREMIFICSSAAYFSLSEWDWRATQEEFL